jgi:DNA-binding transcriptional ArsR family regulator
MIEATLQALLDPHRRSILDVLREGEQPVAELVKKVGLGQPGMSKHLKVLRDAGIVTVQKSAQQRIYALRPDAMAGLDDWLRPYRELWTNSLDALGRQLDSKGEES